MNKLTGEPRPDLLRHLFAHDARDGWLVLLALIQFAILMAGTLSFGAIPWIVSLILGMASAALLTTNYFTIGHNFVHNPFFCNQRLNSAFGCFNSLLIGAPVTLHRIYHFNHHKYDNSPLDARTGGRGDIGSTYRFGLSLGEEEPLLRYAILSYFRNDIPFLVRSAVRKHRHRQLLLELVTIIAMLMIFAVVNTQGLFLFFAPVWLLGTIGSQAQNYLEHHGGTPGDRKHNAVSCYGRFYNWIWFNNGLHQEHHFRPQVHWTKVHEVTPLLPPADERAIVQGSHWLNFGSFSKQNEPDPPIGRQEPA